MSENNLVVPTAFADITQLAEGFADRVDGERLMLYGPEAVADGEWVRFQVTLADQSPALEGMGRAVASIDGGEERPEVARFDIVLDELQLEGTSEVVYERILMVRQAGDSPQTGEVNVEELEAEAAAQAAAAEYAQPQEVASADDGYAEAAVEDVSYEAAADAAPAEEFVEAEQTEIGTPEDFADMSTEIARDGYHEEIESAQAGGDWEQSFDAGPQISHEPEVTAETDIGYGEEYAADAGDWSDSPEATNEVDVTSLEDVGHGRDIPPSAPPPTPPSQPPGFQVQGLGGNGQVLSRPSQGATWEPDFYPAPEPREATGYFAYAGGVPIPPAPPRPDIDSSLRIQPAPRPADDGAGAAAYQEPASSYDEPVADDDAGYDAAPVEDDGGSYDADDDLGDAAEIVEDYTDD